VTRDSFVYRTYDALGRLLYVGVTRNPRQRFAYHRASAAWFGDVASVRMTGPLPRDSARNLERLLILKAGPICNRVRKPPPPRAWADWGHVLDAEVARAEVRGRRLVPHEALLEFVARLRRSA
jgi:hypothetical protein